MVDKRTFLVLIFFFFSPQKEHVFDGSVAWDRDDQASGL